MVPDRFTMETTTKPGRKDAQKEAPKPLPDERARARAYLDLWERNLVLTAMDGIAPGWIAARP
jgi:hypothetical protein